MIFFFDFFISIVFGLIFLPFIIFITILIFIFDGMPIIFKSKRVGYNSKNFYLYKFRTMQNDNKKDKITYLGKFLRRTSLDEIPQIINVFKGEMSLVGPRPYPKKILKKVPKKIKKIRSMVKPGLTGYSQIYFNGKKRKLKEKINLDLYFVKNYSLNIYLKVLILTPFILIKRFLLNKTGETL